MEKLFRFLSKPGVVKFNIVLSLSLARMFRKSRDYYRTLRASDGKSNDGLELNTFERRLRSYFMTFEYLSNSIMIYTTIITIFPAVRVIEYFFEPVIPAKCYLIGRYSPRFIYSEELAQLTIFNHLLWRLAQRFRPPKLKPLCLIFMLFGAHQKEPEAIHNTIFSYEVVYPQSQKQDLIVRVVRPNRTSRAREQLVYRFAIQTTFIYASTAFYCLILIALIIIGVLSDADYLVSYPNCSPGLQQISDAGTLGKFSVSWTWHRLLVTPFDLLQSLVVWTDSLMTVFFGSAVMYLIDYDLELYWDDLERQMHRLYRKIQRANLLNEFGPRYAQKQRKFRNAKSSAECDILELQVGLADFFGQFRAAGTYCSAVLTITTIIWVSTIGFITYMTNFIQVEALPRVLTVGTYTGLAIMVVNNYRLCALHRRVHRSHRMLSSIIAHDNSRFKGKFTGIQEYYARHAGAYKIFGSIPFTSSTFLTLSGWSFSCFAILQSMAKQMSVKRTYNYSKD